MANNYIIRAAGSLNATPPNLVITSPGGSTYSQDLTFSFADASPIANGDSKYFSQYQGYNVQPIFRFPLASNIFVNSVRLSIPNLPGARIANDPVGAVPLIRRGISLAVAGYVGFNNTPFYDNVLNTLMWVGVNNFNEWVPVNKHIEASHFVGTGVTNLRLMVGSTGAGTFLPTLSVDFRNYQTVFSNIYIYMLVELDVTAPNGLY